MYDVHDDDMKATKVALCGINIEGANGTKWWKVRTIHDEAIRCKQDTGARD